MVAVCAGACAATTPCAAADRRGEESEMMPFGAWACAVTPLRAASPRAGASARRVEPSGAMPSRAGAAASGAPRTESSPARACPFFAPRAGACSVTPLRAATVARLGAESGAKPASAVDPVAAEPSGDAPRARAPSAVGFPFRASSDAPRAAPAAFDAPRGGRPPSGRPPVEPPLDGSPRSIAPFAPPIRPRTARPGA